MYPLYVRLDGVRHGPILPLFESRERKKLLVFSLGEASHLQRRMCANCACSNDRSGKPDDRTTVCGYMNYMSPHA